MKCIRCKRKRILTIVPLHQPTLLQSKAPSYFNTNIIMTLFRSGLLACLLASTSYAFAFKPNTQLSQRTSIPNRAPVNLSMSGGIDGIPGNVSVTFPPEWSND